jgi:hypothetical protein
VEEWDDQYKYGGCLHSFKLCDEGDKIKSRTVDTARDVNFNYLPDGPAAIKGDSSSSV